MFKHSLNKNGATKAGILTLLFAMTMMAVSALAVPQVMNTYGDQMSWYSAEANAMGGTGVAVYRGGFSTIFNPAYLVMEEGTRFEAGFSLDQEHEDRFQPMFDAFSSYVANSAIATNRNHLWQTGFALAHRLELMDEMPLSLGLSLADRYPFQYNFEEEIRNPSPYPAGTGEPARDMIIEQRQRKVEGTLRTLSMGMGVPVIEGVSLGASVHYAFGTRTETNTLRDTDGEGDDNSYNQVDEYELAGVNYTIGIRGVVNERLEIGVSWESQLDATGDFTHMYTDVDPSTGLPVTSPSLSAGYYRYPNIYRAGLTFLPQTDPRTVFTMEMIYTPWSEMADSENPGYDNPQNLDDTMDVRIGLQHTFYNGMPVRFGFRHFDSYMDKESGASVFSSGVGMPLLNGMLNGSIELSKITNVLDHQFPYPTDYFGDAFLVDPQASVEDTRFRIGVSYTMNF
jgi:hypothetical protein